MIKKWLLQLWAMMLCQRAWTTEMAVTGVSSIDSAIPEFWARDILTDSNRESFWGQLSGKEGSRMPIIDKTGPLKQKGDTLRFNTIAQLMGTGVTGENVLKGNEEVLSIGVFTVSADVVRHAVAVSRKSTKQANFDEVQTAGSLLKEWMTRKMDADAFTTIISDASDTLYSNSQSSQHTMRDGNGDEFGMSEIDMIRLALLRQGAQPIQIVRQNQRTIPVYGIVFGEIEEYRLYQNSAFLQTIRETWERFRMGGEHPLINNAIGMFKNILLYRYYSVLPITQGTPLRPETTVYATFVTAITHLSVGGATPSSGVIPNYTLFFASSGSLQISDEVLSYTGKLNNAFTGVTRSQAEYYGGSSTTAIQHIPGTPITQRNISSVIGFGAEALFRAIGDDPEPVGDKDDYGEQIGLGIRAYYGQKLKVDKTRGKSKNVCVMKVWSKNPGTI
jgi:N4-gp56 family major capsid protein